MLQASTLAGTPRPPLGCNCGRLPCTQRAPLHPERRTDPLDRSRCRRCRRSALGSRTAAVRALHAVRTRRLSQSVRTPPAPAQLPTHPCDCGSCSFTPLSMPLAIATVSAGDGAAHTGSFDLRLESRPAEPLKRPHRPGARAASLPIAPHHACDSPSPLWPCLRRELREEVPRSVCAAFSAKYPTFGYFCPSHRRRVATCPVQSVPTAPVCSNVAGTPNSILSAVVVAYSR